MRSNKTEIREARGYLAKQKPRGRRNSLTQLNWIHNANTRSADDHPLQFSSTELEGLRSRNGTIKISTLIGLMHPSQERGWDPSRGQGRRQIRTGRTFQVPDRENPGQHFDVRVHTNDNTIRDRNRNAYGNAVVRIQRSQDGRYLVGSVPHGTQNTWVGRNASDQQMNAAHIRAGRAGATRRPAMVPVAPPAPPVPAPPAPAAHAVAAPLPVLPLAAQLQIQSGRLRQRRTRQRSASVGANAAAPAGGRRRAASLGHKI